MQQLAPDRNDKCHMQATHSKQYCLPHGVQVVCPASSCPNSVQQHLYGSAAGSAACMTPDMTRVSCRWIKAVPRLQRMSSTLPCHLKLMSLFLGRTTAGVSTVAPFLWALSSPRATTKRFDMFRMALTFHHILYCAELQVRVSTSVHQCPPVSTSVYKCMRVFIRHSQSDRSSQTQY